MAPKAKTKGVGARPKAAQHKKGQNMEPGRQEAVLAILAATGNVSKACESCGVGRRTYYHWLEDPAFAQRVADAKEEAADALEAEARRRAHDGTSKPVYQGGKLVGHVQEYSDTLLIFLLKGCRPEKYRERADSVNLNVDYSKLTDQQLERIRNGESPLAVVGRR